MQQSSMGFLLMVCEVLLSWLPFFVVQLNPVSPNYTINSLIIFMFHILYTAVGYPDVPILVLAVKLSHGVFYSWLIS